MSDTRTMSETLRNLRALTNFCEVCGKPATVRYPEMDEAKKVVGYRAFCLIHVPDAKADALPPVRLNADPPVNLKADG